jgi:DNA polymerase elongation subunit (family B)
MILKPLPDILKDQYKKDSLVYSSDNEFYYNEEVDKDIIEDINNREFQVYTGHYSPRVPPWKKKQKWSPSNIPTVHLIGRGKRSGKKTLNIEGFLPYCYVEDKNGKYVTYLGKKVKKLIFKTSPAAIGDYRKKFEKSLNPTPYEADIPFIERFMCDTDPFFKPKEIIEPKVAIFDIETNYPINDEIISFSINSEGNIYHNSKYKTPKHKDLILDLYNRLREHDIITGWNVQFDVKHTQNELRKILKDKSFVLNDEVAIIDLKTISNKMYAKQLKGGWSLDNAGKRIANIPKVDIKVNPKDLTPDKLEEYNNRDVVVPEKIDEVLGGLKCHLILSWMTHCILENTELTTVINDITILKAYHNKRVVLPSKPPFDEKPTSKDAQYQAADPQARQGIYENVMAFDLKHAYPWAVQAINATPETKDKNGKYQAPNGIRFNEGYSVFIETLDSIMDERAKAKKKMKEYKKQGNHKMYMTYKYIDFALKTQAAAFSHGEFGYWRSRMKDYEVAEAITQTAKQLIFHTMNVLEFFGFKWVYEHTDSCYIMCPVERKRELIDLINDIVNDYCIEHGYRKVAELEFEEYYPIVYIHTPARNVLVKEDGEWKVTGMNFMRSETPEELADIEENLVRLALEKKSKDDMLKYLKKRIRNLKNISINKLGIEKPYNKPLKEYGGKNKNGRKIPIPYHIKAYLKAHDEYGFDLEVGEKFQIIPILTNSCHGVRKIRRDKVDIAFPLDGNLPKGYKVDYEKYIEHNLIGKIYQFFDMDDKELMNELRDSIPNIDESKKILEKAKDIIKKEKERKKSKKKK